MNWLKEILLKKMIAGYLGTFWDRMNGYKLFSMILLTLLQAAKIYFTVTGSEGASSVLDVIVHSAGDAVNGIASPDEIGVAVTSFLGFLAASHKVVKKVKGLPQVPEIVVKK